MRKLRQLSAIDSQEKQKPSLTIKQSMISGSVAGVVETAINHPLWTIKLRMQRGAPFTCNPALLYRGGLPNILSAIPITAMQVGLNQWYKSVCLKSGNEISSSQSVVGPLFSGVCSAFLSCPTERVMTYQNAMGESFNASVKYLMASGGVRGLFSGLIATMMREGLFTVSLLGATPVIKSKLQPYFSSYYSASLMAEMIAGVGAAIFTQGVDTIKTMQQVASVKEPISLRCAVKQIYSSHGVHGFFKGVIPRSGAMVSATIILDLVNEGMTEHFHNKR